MDDSKIEIIVHTPSIEDFVEVVSIAIKHGITWCDGDTNIGKSNWRFNRTKSCILIEEDVGLWHCNMEWATIKYPNIKISNKKEFLKYITRDKFKNKYDLR